MSKHDVNIYKFDSRSKEEFVADLEDGLKKEAIAINTFREILKNSLYIENPEVIYVGSEEEGKVVFNGEDVANVDLFPDYLLKYKNNRRARCNLIEVKICNPNSRYAYFKKKQLEQYDELSSVIILFVMALATDSPKFILVNPKQILDLDIKPEFIYGKETFKVNVSLFNWERFEASKRDYSVMDKSYIK